MTYYCYTCDMKIVIPHKIALADEHIEELRQLGAEIYDDTRDSATLKERIKDAELITTRTLLDSPELDTTAAIIDAAPRLKYIITPSTGYNHIDVAHATSKGIKVLNCATFNSQAVAEHAVSLLLATNRSLGEGDARLRAGHWDQSGLQGYELAGKQVGLVGYGHIGHLLESLLTGLGMEVRYTRSHSSDAEVTALFQESDYIVVCAPLTDATRGMINAERFAQMKSTAVLINIARGPIVDQAALLTALKSGQIRGAGLDVYSDEPTDSTVPADIVELAQLPNTVTTPHIAYVTHEARTKLGAELLADIKSCIDGAPINVVSH